METQQKRGRGRPPGLPKLEWSKEIYEGGFGNGTLICAFDDDGFLYGIVSHEARNHVVWISGIGTDDFQQGVETRITEAKGIVNELFEEHLINQTELAESRVMASRGLASGDALVARDRKDVNARSFRKTEPVNDGEGAGKAEPVA